MVDVYCKNCGEPWDVLSLDEDFTEEERKMFFKGKGCPACKGIPTMYCEKCKQTFKGWMQRRLIEEYGDKVVIDLIWKEKICPECCSKLKVAKFDEEFIESLIDCDGAVENVTGESILDYI